MKTIEITEEAYNLLCELAGSIGEGSLSNLIIAMDELADISTKKYMDLKEQIERERCFVPLETDKEKDQGT